MYLLIYKDGTMKTIEMFDPNWLNSVPNEDFTVVIYHEGVWSELCSNGDWKPIGE